MRVLVVEAHNRARFSKWLEGHTRSQMMLAIKLGMVPHETFSHLLGYPIRATPIEAVPVMLEPEDLFVRATPIEAVPVMLGK